MLYMYECALYMFVHVCCTCVIHVSILNVCAIHVGMCVVYIHMHACIVHVHVCGCVLQMYVHIYMCVVHVNVYVVRVFTCISRSALAHMCTCKGQRSTLDVSPYCFVLSF